VYIYIYIHTYTYIYTYKARERKRGKRIGEEKIGKYDLEVYVCKSVDVYRYIYAHTY